MKEGIHRFLILIGVIIIVTVFDIHCPIRMIFHIPCPACGMTRAWIFFMHLDFRQAMIEHPLFLLAPVVVLAICFDDIKLKYKDTILGFTGVAFILVYLFRYWIGF